MPLRNPSNPMHAAATTLAAADSVAHTAFLGIFGFRTVTGNGFRAVQIVFAGLAAVGLGLGILGALAVRYGGRTKLATYGVAAVASSTALAGILLAAAAWTGD